MELSKLGETGLKLKSKTATVVVDPSAKSDADAIIIIDPRNVTLDQISGSKVVIDGPGEYEISGVSITGEKIGKNILYHIDDENTQILLASSEAAATAKEEEGEVALVLKSVSPFEAESLSSYVQDVCIVFGTSENLPTGEFVKNPKVNLRRMEDLKGSVVVLAKE